MAEETKAPTAHAGSSGGESRPERSGGDRPERSGPRGPRPGGGPGGPREGGRKYFRRKKVCKFCVEKIEAVNYKMCVYWRNSWLKAARSLRDG